MAVELVSTFFVWSTADRRAAFSQHPAGFSILLRHKLRYQIEMSFDVILFLGFTYLVA
jgi:hypothetical protein